jgi:hypothetical protein
MIGDETGSLRIRPFPIALVKYRRNYGKYK